MDYSPYKSRSRRSRGQGGKISIGLFLISAFIGFLLFWGIKSLFFTDQGEISSPTYIANSSRAEIMIAGDTVWGNLSSGSLVTQGDQVRSQKGNTGELVLKNNSKFTLGLGSIVKMGDVRSSEKSALSGEIFLKEGPILLHLEPEFSDEGLKIWLSDDAFLQASKGDLFFENGGIAGVSGENFSVQKVDSDGKVRYSKTFGVAQYLDLETFSLQGIPEKLKASPLVSNIYGSSRAESDAENTEEKKNPVVIDLMAPTITSPAAQGEMVEVSKSTPLLGTAPEGAKKIVVDFSDTLGNSDSYELKNFLSGSKDWRYTASPHLDNLSEGKNIYKIYSLDAEGNKSSPSTIILNYTPSENSAQIFSSAKGKLLITSPNNGNTTTQSNRIITLKGVAPSNAVYVTVVNKTLGTEYTLKGFKRGNTTWKYWTERMDNGTYSYLVKAQDARRRTISSDTISITVSGSSSSTVSTHSTTSTVSTSEVSTSTAGPKKDKEEAQTSTSSVGTATSEISR